MKIKVEVNDVEQCEEHVEYLIQAIEHRFGIEASVDSDNTVEIELNTDNISGRFALINIKTIIHKKIFEQTIGKHCIFVAVMVTKSQIILK